ncbi:MAG: hypothetical protein ACI4UK_07355 [Floccifex sp.]
MKKILLKSLMLITIFTLSTTTINAKDSVKNEIDTIDKMFEDFNEDDTFIKLPNGGYYHGHAIIVDNEDNNIVLEEYNSDSDPNSLTVVEVKEELMSQTIDENVSKQRGSNLPGSTLILNPGDYYISQKFSGQGWRFSGYYFQCSSGSSGIQKWITYVDSASVGTMGDALNQKNNPNASYGTPIYPGNLKVFGTLHNWGYDSLCYFTYNPIAGSYYKVEA